MEEIRSKLGLLRLTKEEEGSVQIRRGETTNNEQELDRVLVAKVLVVRNIAPEILARTLKTAWRLKGGLEVSSYDSSVTNLFLVKFSDREDKRWVMMNGPWSFGDKLIILAELRKGEQIMDLNLQRTLIWFHTLDLPLDWVIDSVGMKLGAAVGEETEVQKQSCSFWVQAWVKVAKTLMRLVKATDEGCSVRSFPVQYEKLSAIYYQCGCLDHMERDCRVTKDLMNGGQKPYGSWLRYSTKRAVRRESKEKREAEWPHTRTEEGDRRGNPNQGERTTPEPGKGEKENQQVGKQFSAQMIYEGSEKETDTQEEKVMGQKGDQRREEGVEVREVSSSMSESLQTMKMGRGQRIKKKSIKSKAMAMEEVSSMEVHKASKRKLEIAEFRGEKAEGIAKRSKYYEKKIIERSECSCCVQKG